MQVISIISIASIYILLVYFQTPLTPLVYKSPVYVATL
jgi:hypothetical protein